MTTMQLNLAEFERELLPAKAHGGTDVRLSISGFDIPRGVSAEQRGDVLFIVFHYIDDEDAEDHAVDPRLKVRVGKRSGKVLGFVLSDIGKEVPSAGITAHLSAGLDAQLRGATRDNQRLNYKLIRDLVTAKLGPKLQQEFAPA